MESLNVRPSRAGRGGKDFSCWLCSDSDPDGYQVVWEPDHVCLHEVNELDHLHHVSRGRGHVCPAAESLWSSSYCRLQSHKYTNAQNYYFLLEPTALFVHVWISLYEFVELSVLARTG